MIIEEWFKHYLDEGVEHFYLIDNGSTDDYESKIEKFKPFYTLIKDDTRLPRLGTQSFLYNKHYLETVKKETEWLIVCDIDEYIYARNGHVKIPEVLDKLPKHIKIIWIPWKIFGSNGHKKQPANIVQSFNKHFKQYTKKYGYGKTISRPENIIELDVHLQKFNKPTLHYTSSGDLYDDYDFSHENVLKLDLHLNHYMLMSEEYYEKIKCTRGGGASGNVSKYTMKTFYELNSHYSKHLIEDNELKTKKSKID